MNVKMNLPIAQTYHYSSKGAEIKVHAISTGMVKVKENFRTSKWRGKIGLINSFLSRSFTEWMPIWVWVIEHPEGNFLIDTGEIEAVNEEDYFKSSGAFENWMNTTQFKFKISRQEEIDQQLKQLNLTTTSIHKVFITHLHLDHVEGIKHFPNCKIFVHKKEWDKPYGDLPKLYPDWFLPELIETQTRYKSFKNAYPLTKVRDFWMVHTPGHTSGHCSFLLELDDLSLFFAGDVSYTQAQLKKNVFSAANESRNASEDTYASIMAYANENSCIYLPSHDWTCINRLQKLEYL